MNFRRRRPRRSVRCTLCTPARWRGNSADKWCGRHKPKENDLRKVLDRERRRRAD